MSIIKSKAEMYDLYHAGAFGNRLATWASIADFKTSGVARPVTMRYKGESGGKWVAYGVDPSDVPAVASKWEAEGANLNLVTLNEAAPDHLLICQGEVMRSAAHYDLRYSTAPLPMRQALATTQRHATGLVALSILNHFLDASSLSDLHWLLDEYDGAVVEFSTWATDIGCIPHRNTVFWEVRHY